MLSQQAFLEGMSSLSELFGKQLSQGEITIYYGALKRTFEDDDFKQVCESATSRFRFFPKPAEIIECGLGSVEERAAFAWEQVRQAIGSHGSYASVDFEDKAINVAIRTMGGWTKLCQSPEDELHFTQRNFASAYSIAANHGPKYLASAGKALPGIAERRNVLTGHEPEKPVTVKKLESISDIVRACIPGSTEEDD